MRFGLTETHDCTYISGRTARNLFYDPLGEPAEEVATMLTRAGFRRTGDHLFRPLCPDCKACVPLRLRLNDFKPQRRHRRIWRRNQDLTVEIQRPDFREDWYQLYHRYIVARHPHSDMCPPSRDQFRRFLLSRWGQSLFLCVYQQSRPMSVAVTDVVGEASSALYTFYDPAEMTRSLGIYSILLQATLSRLCGKKYLYLGYWINGHVKMHYKMDFHPSELMLEDGRWVACGNPSHDRSHDS